MSAAEIGNLLVRMSIDTAEFANGVKGIQGSLTGLTNSLKGFAASAALAEVFNLSVDAIKSVAEIGDVAESIGVTAEQLQVFQKMAIASGTSTDVLTRGLQTIAEQSVDANSALSKLFEANGLSAKGKEVNQIILMFMDLVKNARTPAEQLAIITGVLGDKVGRQLVEALRAGGGAFEETMRQMVADGTYHTDAEVARLQEIETKYNEVTHNIGVIWEQMVVGLIQRGGEFWAWLQTTTAAVTNQMTTPEITAKLDQTKAQLANYEAQLAAGLSGRAKFAVEEEIKRLKSLIAIYEQAAKVADLPDLQGADGKGSLPGNVNPNTYQLEKPTRMVTKTDTAPKPKPVTPITLADIRGPALELKNLEAQLRDTDVLAKQLADDFVGGLGSALANAAMNAKSLGDAFEMLKATALDALGSIAQMLLRNGLNSLFGMGGTALGGAQGFMGFGGFYASGGTLGAGQWGIAGEAGPEIIHGPARITPMGVGGGATSVSWSPSITINGSADDRKIAAVMASEREKFKAELPRMIRDSRKRGRI